MPRRRLPRSECSRVAADIADELQDVAAEEALVRFRVMRADKRESGVDSATGLSYMSQVDAAEHDGRVRLVVTVWPEPPSTLSRWLTPFARSVWEFRDYGQADRVLRSAS